MNKLAGTARCGRAATHRSTISAKYSRQFARAMPKPLDPPQLYAKTRLAKVGDSQAEKNVLRMMDLAKALDSD